jgi:glycosyltransferase involved in cell wall biosynthesis
MHEGPFVSIVVPTYNRSALLQACIESLFALSYPAGRYEVIIVNDGSTDDTENILGECGKKASCAYRWFTVKNAGIAAARNIGIMNSTGTIICLTDDDCVVEKNWISNLVRGFDRDCVGGVGGMVKAEKLDSYCERYTDDSHLLSQQKFRSMNFLIGCNVGYRKSALEKAGSFDVFFNACEDVDLAIRVQLSGYALGYADDAVVYHMHRRTLKGLFSQQYRNGIGYMRLHKKYTRDFNPDYKVITLTYRLLFAVLLYPYRALRAIFSNDRGYLLVRPLLSMTVTLAFLLGILRDLLFGRGYNGKKIFNKTPFIEDESMNALVRKIRLKFA